MANSITPNASRFDLPELMFQFYLSEAGYFANYTEFLEGTLPSPYWQLTVSSNDQTPVSVRGRMNLSVQVVGINTTTGDTLAIQGSIDGKTWVAMPMTNMTSGTSAASITADGIYVFKYSGTLPLWYVKAVTTAGVNTGATNVYVMART